MQMAMVKAGKKKMRQFLNFPVDDDLMAQIDAAAEASGIVRAKQARALIEYALGYVRKPYIPEEHQAGLPFKQPTRKAHRRKLASV